MATEFNVNKAVGQALRALREKRGESQATVGKAVGRSQESISQLENGRRTPTAKDIYTFADYYGTSVNTILPDPESAVAEAKQSLKEGNHGKSEV